MKIVMAAMVATLAGPALAQTAAPQAFDAAVRALNQRIDRLPPKTPLPRTSDPEVARLIAVTSDSDARFGTAEFPVRALDTFVPVCAASSGLMTRYLLVGVTPEEAKAPASRAFTAKVIANTRAYQNEIMPLLRFGIRCNALHIPALEQFTARLTVAELTQTRRDGLAQMRQGISQILQGAVETLGQPGIRPENSTALLRQVVSDAPVLARVLTLPQRADLAARVAVFTKASPPSIRSDLDRLRAALADQRCEGLCAIA